MTGWSIKTHVPRDRFSEAKKPKPLDPDTFNSIRESMNRGKISLNLTSIGEMRAGSEQRLFVA
jgi:hypothetical protein